MVREARCCTILYRPHGAPLLFSVLPVDVFSHSPVPSRDTTTAVSLTDVPTPTAVGPADVLTALAGARAADPEVERARLLMLRKDAEEQAWLQNMRDERAGLEFLSHSALISVKPPASLSTFAPPVSVGQAIPLSSDTDVTTTSVVPTPAVTSSGASAPMLSGLSQFRVVAEIPPLSTLGDDSENLSASRAFLPTASSSHRRSTPRAVTAVGSSSPALMPVSRAVPVSRARTAFTPDDRARHEREDAQAVARTNRLRLRSAARSVPSDPSFFQPASAPPVPSSSSAIPAPPPMLASADERAAADSARSQLHLVQAENKRLSSLLEMVLAGELGAAQLQGVPLRTGRLPRMQKDYLRAFRLLVSSVTGSERVLAPSVGMVLELVRQSVTRQFPTLSPLLYPGTLATDTTPFASIDAMWDAFAPFHTNKTPAMAGSNYFSLPQATGSSKSRRSAPVASKSFGQGAQGSISSASKSFGSGAQGSSAADPIVLAVSAQGSSSDPFTVDYACWPATHDYWPEVYMVSTSSKTHDDPLLWTALLTQDARNQAFASCRGKCLNCGSPDHSMKTCRNGYINQSGLLNSELAHNPDAFQRWQRRMVSHRRSGNTSGSRSNRHSRGRAPFSGSQRRSSSHNASLSGPSPQSSGTALALHPLQHSAAQASASSGAIVPSTSNTGHN